MSEMQRKLWRQRGFRDAGDEAYGNYPDFEILAHVINFQQGLQGLIVKNVEGESAEANDLTYISKKWVCCVNNSKCCCLKLLHINAELKRKGIRWCILPANNSNF